MGPVCCNCKCEMYCFKTGMYITHDSRKWACDGFQCPDCGARITTGYGGELIIYAQPIHIDDWVVSLDGKVPNQHIDGDDPGVKFTEFSRGIDTGDPTG